MWTDNNTSFENDGISAVGTHAELTTIGTAVTAGISDASGQALENISNCNKGVNLCCEKDGIPAV